MGWFNKKRKGKETPNYTIAPGDIWTIVGLENQERIPKGFTIYGEVVGYMPSGAPIQSMKGKAYHYGCSDREHALRVYRVTFTNEDGKVFELSWKHMLQFCAQYGLDPVIEEFYGTAEQFVLKYHPNATYRPGEGWEHIPSAKLPEKAWKNPIEPELPENHGPEKTEFSQLFLEAVEHTFLEQMCEHNRREVPREGVVIRIDGLGESTAFKSKSFLFFSWETEELDKKEGIMDIETSQSLKEEDSE